MTIPDNRQNPLTEVSLLLVIAEDEKLSCVPGPTEPVLVIERPGLAAIFFSMWMFTAK